MQVTTFPVPTVLDIMGCHISISFPADVDLLNFLERRRPTVKLSADNWKRIRQEFVAFHGEFEIPFDFRLFFLIFNVIYGFKMEKRILIVK